MLLEHKKYYIAIAVGGGGVAVIVQEMHERQGLFGAISSIGPAAQLG